MNNTDPFFSIIIPTYQREKLIGNTIASVLAQAFSNFEIIVVDDGGKDHTAGVVAAFQSPQVYYYKKENGERGAARNFGVVRARGRYITFLDSDDVLYPQHLEVAYQFLTAHPEVCCYAQAYEIKEAVSGNVLVPGAFVQSETINEKIIQGNLLSCFGVFVKKEVLTTLNFEEDRLFAGTEDWLLWLQLAARYPFYYNNKVTGAMLEHESRSVLSFREESLAYRTRFLKLKLEADSVFVQRFGHRSINKIYAHMLTYTSLHLAMGKKRGRALHYWFKALQADRGEIMTRRSLAIAKKLLFI